MTKKKLKKFGVIVPITGQIYVEVEAANVDEAIDASLMSDQLTNDNIDNWDAHRIICEGNVFNGSLNEAAIVEECEEDDE